MRQGVLSDEYIIHTNPAFFPADEKTHNRTLSQYHAQLKLGRRRPYRARRPRIPFFTLYDTARYVDRANPYETAHEMVVNYTATVTPSSEPSTPALLTPRLPNAMARGAAAFDQEYPELQDAPLSSDVKAFIHFSELDPERVLYSRSLGRFGGGERVYLRNSLDQVEQRALDFTYRRPEEHQRVIEAMRGVQGDDDDEGGLFER